MLRTMLKSKIHRARVTGACIDYEGSVTIDAALLEAADIMEYEQVHIYNVSNGERFATYAIAGEPNGGEICLNGAAARKVSVNDLVIICSYAVLDDAVCKGHKSKNVYVDRDNHMVKKG
ncbi:MAG: aspartate 1-decarboxylase [Desulfomonile tiedjei]|nr:aspartate 1-decarboxylase [Desulfomonile tiedjei]